MIRRKCGLSGHIYSGCRPLPWCGRRSQRLPVEQHKLPPSTWNFPAVEEIIMGIREKRESITPANWSMSTWGETQALTKVDEKRDLSSLLDNLNRGRMFPVRFAGRRTASCAIGACSRLPRRCSRRRSGRRSRRRPPRRSGIRSRSSSPGHPNTAGPCVQRLARKHGGPTGLPSCPAAR